MISIFYKVRTNELKVIVDMKLLRQLVIYHQEYEVSFPPPNSESGSGVPSLLNDDTRSDSLIKLRLALEQHVQDKAVFISPLNSLTITPAITDLVC